jgi:DNA-binding LacI/PurR family transcriptional regulator
MATMREVAQAAGVSIATVSFVVNNTKPLTPATRRRIEQAMADLGFRRNMVARALASRRTQIIALVCPFSQDRMAPTVREFIIGAARAAKEADHHLVIWPVSNDGDELAALLGQKLVDGVLLMDVQMDDARVELLRRLDTPFALIGRTRDLTGLHYIDIDMAASVRMAMDHLAGLGHREIAFINGRQEQDGFGGFGPYVRSEQAYRALAEDRRVKPVVLHCRQSVRSGQDVAGELLATAPETTAVIIGDEAAAPGLIAELTRRGRTVPGDISVMSLLSSVDVAAMCNPPLTTVTAPGIELGRLGVQALICLLDGTRPATPALRTGVLSLGESTGPVRPGSREAMRGRRTAGTSRTPRRGPAHTEPVGRE